LNVLFFFPLGVSPGGAPFPPGLDTLKKRRCTPHLWPKFFFDPSGGTPPFLQFSEVLQRVWDSSRRRFSFPTTGLPPLFFTADPLSSSSDCQRRMKCVCPLTCDLSSGLTFIPCFTCLLHSKIGFPPEFRPLFCESCPPFPHSVLKGYPFCLHRTKQGADRAASLKFSSIFSLPSPFLRHRFTTCRWLYPRGDVSGVLLSSHVRRPHSSLRPSSTLAEVDFNS